MEFRLPSNLESAVLLTISYSDQFDFPLTLEEIVSRLVSFVDSDDFLQLSPAAQFQEIKAAIQALIEREIVAEAKGFYFLRGRAELVETRLERQQFSRQKQADIEMVLGWFKRIPWIVGGVVTGSLAVENAVQASDVDFLIVTTPRRLWLSRLVMLIVTWLHGKRRSWNHPVDRSWCFNMWVDTDHLQVPRHKQSIYTAYEVNQAKWVFGNLELRRHFYDQNAWSKHYLPTYWQQRTTEVTDSSSNTNKTNSSLLDWLLSGMDYVAYVLQYAYMYSHMTREWVGRGYAYFHPRDTQHLVYYRWLRSLLLLDISIPKKVLKTVDTALFAGKAVVFATGVFDLFHTEHRRFLSKARAVGGTFLVGVESDRRVAQLKGPDRPIMTAVERIKTIEESGLVDAVFELPDQFNTSQQRLQVLQILHPHILAVSSHSPHLDKKQQLMRKVGGVVRIVHQHNPAISTTKLLQQHMSKLA